MTETLSRGGCTLSSITWRNDLVDYFISSTRYNHIAWHQTQDGYRAQFKSDNLHLVLTRQTAPEGCEYVPGRTLSRTLPVLKLDQYNSIDNDEIHVLEEPEVGIPIGFLKPEFDMSGAADWFKQQRSTRILSKLLGKCADRILETRAIKPRVDEMYRLHIEREFKSFKTNNPLSLLMAYVQDNAMSQTHSIAA